MDHLCARVPICDQLITGVRPEGKSNLHRKRMGVIALPWIKVWANRSLEISTCRVKARSYHELLHFCFVHCPPSKPQRSIPGFSYVLADQYHEFRLTFIYIVLLFITQCGKFTYCMFFASCSYLQNFARICTIFPPLHFHPRFDSIDQSKRIPLCIVIWPRLSGEPVHP